MKLLSLLTQVSRLRLAAAILASIVSGVATMGAIICVLESVRSGKMLLWQFAAIATLAVASRALSRALLNRLGAWAFVRLRRQLIRSILHLPLLHLERTGSTSFLVAFTSDLATVAAAVRSFVTLFSSSAFLVSCIAYLGWLSPARTVVAAALLVLCIAVAFLLRRIERGHGRLVRVGWDGVVQLYKSMLDGIKEMKVSQPLARRLLQMFATRAHEQQELASKRTRYSDGVATWVQLMFFVILGTAVFGPFGDEPHLGVGYGLLAILYIRGTLQSFIRDSGAFADASVALQRITALGLTFADDPESDNAHMPNARTWTTLTLQAVSFEYQNDDTDRSFLLGPLDISFHPGEIVFVSGDSGSGKTTLTKLLTRLYAPTSGVIHFNDVPITDANARWYRRHFSVVFSDFCLLEDVLTNSHDEFDRRSTSLADRLELTQNVLSGSSYAYSAGERRRAALFTALLQDRPILIFDELAADQDAHYKELFYTDILPSLRTAGKLVIVMTHDERYFYIADRVLRLERDRPPKWKEIQLKAG